MKWTNFFQQSLHLLDEFDWIERYVWFGVTHYLNFGLGMVNQLVDDYGQLSYLDV